MMPKLDGEAEGTVQSRTGQQRNEPEQKGEREMRNQELVDEDEAEDGS